MLAILKFRNIDRPTFRRSNFRPPPKYNIKQDVSSLLATFKNIIEMCKIGKFQRNFSSIFQKLLNIY